MAKETNYATVQEAIERHLETAEWSIEELIGHDMAVLAILNIYMANDVCKGFGQDFHNQVSIISSTRAIGILIDRRSSYYKDDNNICLYDDLNDDINEILIVMQAAYDRMDR